MIILIRLLLGVLGGGALCVRYLRQEMAGDVGPGLRRVQMQLDCRETEINLALATRLADLSRGNPQAPHHSVVTMKGLGLPRDQPRDGNVFWLADNDRLGNRWQTYEGTSIALRVRRTAQPVLRAIASQSIVLSHWIKACRSLHASTALKCASSRDGSRCRTLPDRSATSSADNIPP